MIETGRASLALADGTTEFTLTAETADRVMQTLDGLGRRRSGHRVSEPRYLGIRKLPVGDRTWTVAEFEADFEVPA